MTLYGSLELPPDQIQALRTINVEIHGGQHGFLTRVEPYGLACLGVVDGDYAGIDDIVNRLDPERGDVLAYESTWHDPANDNTQFAGRMQEIVNESTLLDVNPFDLSVFAAQVRRGMVLDTHDYAQCRALAKGLRAEYADATEADQHAWLTQRTSPYPPGLAESSAFRNVKIVERLGAIAVTMDMGRRWNRPTLAMVVGDHHTFNLKRHLRASRVRAKIRRYSPNLAGREALDLEYITANQPPPNKERWLENARRIASELG